MTTEQIKRDHKNMIHDYYTMFSNWYVEDVEPYSLNDIIKADKEKEEEKKED